MPVSLPARSALRLATARNSLSPIMRFCSDGRAAANAAALREAPCTCAGSCGRSWACPSRPS
eukprot:6564854-Lingulodinium_polyedra.AAC.1